jgi:hypothetical protein
MGVANLVPLRSSTFTVQPVATHYTISLSLLSQKCPKSEDLLFVLLQNQSNNGYSSSNAAIIHDEEGFCHVSFSDIQTWGQFEG